MKVFHGKRLFIKYLSNGGRTVNFNNSNGEIIYHTPNGEYGVKEVSMLMPIDTRTINFGYGNRDLLYEVGYNYNYIVTPL